jgi:hypothetical protein
MKRTHIVNKIVVVIVVLLMSVGICGCDWPGTTERRACLDKKTRWFNECVSSKNKFECEYMWTVMRELC